MERVEKRELGDNVGEMKKRSEIARANRTVRPETLPLTSSTLQVPHWPPPLQFNSLPGEFGACQRQPRCNFPELRLLIQAQGSRDPRPTSGQTQGQRAGSGSETYPSWCSTRQRRRSSCRCAAPRPWGAHERVIRIQSLSENTRNIMLEQQAVRLSHTAFEKMAEALPTSMKSNLATNIWMHDELRHERAPGKLVFSLVHLKRLVLALLVHSHLDHRKGGEGSGGGSTGLPEGHRGGRREGVGNLGHGGDRDNSSSGALHCVCVDTQLVCCQKTGSFGFSLCEAVFSLGKMG